VEVVEKHNASLLGGAGMRLVKINCVSSKAWLDFIEHKVQWTWKMEQMVMWFTEVHLLHYTTHTHLSTTSQRTETPFVQPGLPLAVGLLGFH
jgi:hypothetical protein